MKLLTKVILHDSSVLPVTLKQLLDFIEHLILIKITITETNFPTPGNPDLNLHVLLQHIQYTRIINDIKRSVSHYHSRHEKICHHFARVRSRIEALREDRKSQAPASRGFLLVLRKPGQTLGDLSVPVFLGCINRDRLHFWYNLC